MQCADDRQVVIKARLDAEFLEVFTKTGDVVTRTTRDIGPLCDNASCAFVEHPGIPPAIGTIAHARPTLDTPSSHTLVSVRDRGTCDLGSLTPYRERMKFRRVVMRLRVA